MQDNDNKTIHFKGLQLAQGKPTDVTWRDTPVDFTLLVIVHHQLSAYVDYYTSTYFSSDGNTDPVFNAPEFQPGMSHGHTSCSTTYLSLLPGHTLLLLGHTLLLPGHTLLPPGHTLYLPWPANKALQVITS